MSSPGAKFIWPPRPAAAREPAQAPSRPHAVSATPRAAAQPGLADSSLWASIEREFLDVTARPLRERAAEANWTPDDPAAYCGRCGRTASGISPAPAGCESCRDVRFAWSRMVRLGDYAGPLRTWIHEVKYTRWRRLGHDLGAMLGESLLSQWAVLGAATHRPLIVPVPDSGLRRILRGIDHAAVIAHGVQARTGWDIAQPLFRRFGPSQVSVAPSERASNVARSFGLRKGSDTRPFVGRPLILVDDVLTTGATMRSCARLLLSACHKGTNGAHPGIWAAVLARTAEPGPPKQGRFA